MSTIDNRKERNKVQVNIELPIEVREMFRLASKQRGLSMSGVLHNYIRQVILEEKSHYPELFQQQGIYDKKN